MTAAVAEDEPQASENAQDFEVVIRECNSIGKAAITLRPGALNIKYGPNGLGKSTIGHALTYKAESAERDSHDHVNEEASTSSPSRRTVVQSAPPIS